MASGHLFQFGQIEMGRDSARLIARWSNIARMSCIWWKWAKWSHLQVLGVAVLGWKRAHGYLTQLMGWPESLMIFFEMEEMLSYLWRTVCFVSFAFQCFLGCVSFSPVGLDEHFASWTLMSLVVMLKKSKGSVFPCESNLSVFIPFLGNE